jgi:hypothetical protein
MFAMVPLDPKALALIDVYPVILIAVRHVTQGTEYNDEKLYLYIFFFAIKYIRIILKKTLQLSEIHP